MSGTEGSCLSTSFSCSTLSVNDYKAVALEKKHVFFLTRALKVLHVSALVVTPREINTNKYLLAQSAVTFSKRRCAHQTDLRLSHQ